MKKIFIAFLLIISILFVGCNEKEIIDNEVEIIVNSDIKIEIDSLNDFKWSRVITIKVNGEIMPYAGTSVNIKEGEEILPDKDVWFVASYSYDGKIYTQNFQVKIYKYVKNNNISFVFLDGQIRTFNILENEVFNINNVNVDVYDSNYVFKGWYRDALFLEKYDDDIINEEIKLYGRWDKINNVSMDNTSKSDIEVRMMTYIDNLITSTDSFVPSWNKEGFKGRWNYIDGVFLNSIVNLYEQTNKDNYKDFFLNYIDYYIDSDGNFINPTDLSSGYKSGELDSVCASRILFDAYNYTKDSRYLKAIEFTYNELINMPLTINGYSYSHKSSYLNQIWLDGMYMYVPYLARYALFKEDLNIFDIITKQYKYIRDNMFDEEMKLYYHGHDTSKTIFWSDDNTGNSKSFWLRSIGWYIVSIVDVLEFFPEGDNKDYLISLLKEVVNGLMKYQDEASKMFYQLVDKPATLYLIPAKYLEGLKNGNVDKSIANYLESSGSSMIAYTLIKGARLGYLDSNYSSLGKEIFEGVFNNSFKDGSLHNICITAGLGPENNKIRDGSIYYYLAEKVGSDDAKGVGPFIMAFLEYIN